MARTSLKVIKFSKYDQAIYPHDYYVECKVTDTDAISVLENGANAANEINFDNDALIGADGKALYSAFTGGKYVLKVLGFFKLPDSTSKEFEFVMGDKDEKYVLVAKNSALVPEYYIEVPQATTGKLKVVASNATEGEINFNSTALINAYGVALYENNPSPDKYVLKVSGDKTLTIKMGNSIQGVEDKVYTLRHGGTYYIVLESGKYKNVSGDEKGKVIIAAEDKDLVEAAILCLE